MLLSLDACNSDNADTVVVVVVFDLLILDGTLMVAERPALDDDCFLPFRTPGILLLPALLSSSFTDANGLPLIVDVLRLSGVNAVSVECCWAASEPSFDAATRRLATTDAAVVGFGTVVADVVEIPDCVFRSELRPLPTVGLVLLLLPDASATGNTPADVVRPNFAGTLVALIYDCG